MKKNIQKYILLSLFSAAITVISSCDKEPGKGLPYDNQLQGTEPAAVLNKYAGTWEVTNANNAGISTFRFSNGLCWVDELDGGWSYSIYQTGIDPSSLLFFDGSQYVESVKIDYIDDYYMYFTYQPPFTEQVYYIESAKVFPISYSNWSKLMLGFWELTSSTDAGVEAGSYWFFCQDGIIKYGTPNGYFSDRSWSVVSDIDREISIAMSGWYYTTFIITQITNQSMILTDELGHTLKFSYLY